MGIQITGVIGPQVTTDGTGLTPLRQGRSGELIASELHGKYYEQAYRGNVFSVVQPSAGVVLTSGSNNPSFALCNPLGSGKNLSLIRIGFVIKVLPGTPIIGQYKIIQHPGMVQLATGTALTITGMPIGSQNKSIAAAFSSVTANLVNVQDLEPLWQKTATAEAPVQPPPLFSAENLDGRIVIAPGAAISIQQDANDTTNATACCFAAWEEVPV